MNLLSPLPDARAGEIVDILLGRPGVRIERIVSWARLAHPVSGTTRKRANGWCCWPAPPGCVSPTRPSPAGSTLVTLSTSPRIGVTGSIGPTQRPGPCGSGYFIADRPGRLRIDRTERKLMQFPAPLLLSAILTLVGAACQPNAPFRKEPPPVRQMAAMTAGSAPRIRSNNTLCRIFPAASFCSALSSSTIRASPISATKSTHYSAGSKRKPATRISRSSSTSTAGSIMTCPTTAMSRRFAACCGRWRKWSCGGPPLIGRRARWLGSMSVGAAFVRRRRGRGP